MGYKEEFPDYVLDVQIPEGFEDCSWHNDVCPHWEKILNKQTGERLELWIDYKEVEKR